MGEPKKGEPRRAGDDAEIGQGPAKGGAIYTIMQRLGVDDAQARKLLSEARGDMNAVLNMKK